MKIEKIPLKERRSVVFLGRGQVSVKDGSMVFHKGDKNAEKISIPAGGTACLMLEPGTRISHSAVKLAARQNCMVVWVGEGGVRMYATAFTSDHAGPQIMLQSYLASNSRARLEVVKKMFEIRFNEELPEFDSVRKIRGFEGARVRDKYNCLALKYGIDWSGRVYNVPWNKMDLPNYCLCVAAACLNAISEAAIRTAGYSPAIGFMHRGDSRSFVFDIADLFKFDFVVPVAFKVASQAPSRPESRVRHMCRDRFREFKFLKKIIPTIKEVLKVGVPYINIPEGEEKKWHRWIN
ncbi:MAG: type I-E CRISPR-associated endonuclease Cas1e [bacterium]